MGESPWKFESSWPHQAVCIPHPDTQKPDPNQRSKGQFRLGFLIFDMGETISLAFGLQRLRPAFGAGVSDISFSSIPENRACQGLMEILHPRSLFDRENSDEFFRSHERSLKEFR